MRSVHVQREKRERREKEEREKEERRERERREEIESHHVIHFFITVILFQSFQSIVHLSYSDTIEEKILNKRRNRLIHR